MPTLRSTFVLWIASSIVAGCGPVAPGDVVVEEYQYTELPDTAREVLSEAPREVWSISSEPMTEVGSLADERDDGIAFQDVRGTFLRSDDVLVVGDGAGRVRLFNEDGSRHGAFGRAGEGPGEFSAHGAISRLFPGDADTIIVHEFGTARLSFFGPEGEFGRSTRLGLVDGIRPSIRGRFGDGSLLVKVEHRQRRRSDAEPNHVWQSPEEWGRMRELSDGWSYDSLGTVPGFQYYGYPDGRGTGDVSLRRFSLGAVPTLAAGLDRVYFGRSDVFEIWAADLDGDVFHVIRRPDPTDRELSRADIRAFRDQRIERAPSEPGLRRRWVRDVERLPVASRLPAHRAMLVDRTGLLWVQTYPHPLKPTTEWSVFDKAGAWLATVELPASLHISDIGPDYLVGVRTDRLGVESVVRYRLNREGFK